MAFKQDEGYAWVILAASFGCNYLTGVMVYFVGVVHAELLRKYHGDVTLTAWAGAIYSSLQTMGAPIACWVVQRQSCRCSVVTGGVLLCVGFAASAFVTSVTQLIFTYGLVAGVGFGLTYAPTLMTVNYYFARLRGLASGISVSAAALGILSGPLLTQTFIDVYGMSGAFLLIAGLAFHFSVFGMFFTPAPQEGSRSRHSGTITDAELEVRGAQDKSCCEENPVSMDREVVDSINSDLCVKDEDGKMSPLVTTHKQTRESETLWEDAVEEELSDAQRSLLQADRTSSTLMVDGVSSQTQSKGMEERRFQSASSPKRRCSQNRNNLNSRKTVGKQVYEYFSELVLLAKNKSYVCHCVSVCFANTNMAGVNLHLPEYAQSQGTSPTMAAALFVGVGILSLISRLVSGFVVTSPRVNALVLSVFLMAVCGVATCLFPLYSATYGGQMTFACLFGLGTGGFYTLINVLTVQLVGVQSSSLTTAYGVQIFVMGAGYVIGPPLSALVVDMGGTYEQSFVFLGMAMLVSAAADLAAFVLEKMKQATHLTNQMPGLVDDQIAQHTTDQSDAKDLGDQKPRHRTNQSEAF